MQVTGIKPLVGIAVERDFDNFYLAIDADYWQWNVDVKRWLKKNWDFIKVVNN